MRPCMLQLSSYQDSPQKKVTAFLVPEKGEPVSDEHFVQVKAAKAYSRSLIKVDE